MIEDVVTTILLSVALAMDAFAMAITLGMSGLANRIIDRSKIGFTFGIFQGVLFLFGFLTLNLVGQKLLAFNKYLAALLLLYLGIKMLIDSFQKKQETCPNNNECINCRQRKCLKTGEYRFLTWGILLLYGTATAIDSFAAGFSYGLVNDECTYTAIIVGITTLIFSLFGARFGGKLKVYIGKKATIFGGIILVLLAIKQIM